MAPLTGFEECLTREFKISAWEKAVSYRPAILLTDCKSVYDSLNQIWTSSSADKRTAIDLAIIREGLSRDSSCVRWIDTKYQLVDSLTKKGCSGEFLRHSLDVGCYQIVDEALALDVRNVGRSRRGVLQDRDRHSNEGGSPTHSLSTIWLGKEKDTSVNSNVLPSHS